MSSSSCRQQQCVCLTYCCMCVCVCVCTEITNNSFHSEGFYQIMVRLRLRRTARMQHRCSTAHAAHASWLAKSREQLAAADMRRSSSSDEPLCLYEPGAAAGGASEHSQNS